MDPFTFWPEAPLDPPVTVLVDTQAWVWDLPTTEWIGAWASAAFVHLAVMGRDPRGRPGGLLERLADPRDPFDLIDCRDLSHQITQAVTGMSWPRAVRLARLAAGAWPILDARAHFDPLTAPPRRVMSLALRLKLESAEDNDGARAMAKRLESPRHIPGCPQKRRPARRGLPITGDLSLLGITPDPAPPEPARSVPARPRFVVGEPAPWPDDDGPEE
ncbi:hypothetical protein [Streptomyces sp. NPDC087300]|uniref:hypothetical protein n=1 Tax=Streptomyces sp. NPDC087300 TaxID=3365780 RepID=UPI00380B3C00